MNIVLLGPPGSGKGTQARLIQERYNLALIGTGDILREEIKKGSSLGREIKDIMEEGRYPSDDIILAIFEKRLKGLKEKGTILDGVPRTLNQAKKVDEIFARLGRKLDAVIHLAVNDEELVKRLSHRFLCRTCGTPYTNEFSTKIEGVCDKCSGREFIRRLDDEPDAIKTRLEVYNEQTKPLLGYYSATNRLTVVDGMKPVKDVTAQIESLLGKLQVLTSNSGCLYSAQDI
ncbi:MAG: adenylate kinase [Alphaproteobacteria bacterium]|nr:adenylate kinase [Alphaproteobacteria bacterium]